jgi:hypothetical protein
MYFEEMELLGHSPIRIFKERRVTWIFSYAYFEGMELLGHSPIRILKKRRFTWTFSYAYFEGMESYLNILFKIRIGECPSYSILSKYA